MQRNRIEIAASLLAVVLLAGASAFAGDDTKGMIISRTGETLIVSSAGTKTTVVLTDDTKVQDKRGVLGIRKKQFGATVLIPGLKVSVNGTTDDQGRVVAKAITFDGDDLETAEMIQAGIHPTAEQVAANQQNIATNKEDIAANKVQTAANKENIETNQQNIASNKADIQKNIDDIEENTKRFTELGEYDLKAEGTINFKPGSSKISKEDLARLDQVAEKAKVTTGYIIEVKGYADSTGDAKMNTKLSQDRAEGVINYLVQHGVPVRHITAPGVYGETNEVASNETSAGRAENRRVEIKVLINKGIAGN
jgi:outer membrane protein OmpA-like peptidoglycan-associated protein